MKFRIGDWIRSKDGLDTAKVTNSTIDFYKEGFYVALEDEWELWQPKKGEWCWFWFDMSSTPELGQFKEMFNGDLFCSIQNGNDVFKFCEPFRGELPSCLKNKH